MADNIKKIIFLGSVAEAEEYLRSAGKAARGSDLCIAMRPVVLSYLERHGARGENTLPYFDNDSHAGALRKSGELVGWLENEASFDGLGMGLEKAFRDSFISWTRFGIQYCLWAIEIVSNAVEKHKPETISSASYKKRYAASLYLEPEERYLSIIVKAVALKNGLAYDGFPAGSFRPDAFIGAASHFIWQPARYFLANLKYILWETAVIVKSRLSGVFRPANIVLYASPNYNLGALAEKTAGEVDKGRPCLLEGPALSFGHMPFAEAVVFSGRRIGSVIRQREIMRGLACKIASGADPWRHRGVDLGVIIGQKLNDNISGFIVSLSIWSLRLDRLMRRLKPAAFLSNGERHDDIIIAEIARRLGVKAVLISHGSHVAPKNEQEAAEWGEHGRMLLRMPFSYVALQSPLAEEFLKAFPTESRGLITGPLLWGRPSDKNKSAALFDKVFGPGRDRRRIRIVLHANSPKRSKNVRFQVFETPDEYLRSIMDVSSAVEKMPDTFLVIRFRPRDDIDESALKRFVKFSGKVLLNVEGDFADALGMADLLISFSSTTIEEALQNSVPVLLYGGSGRYKHVPAFGISEGCKVEPSAVYHAERPSDLEYAIGSALDIYRGMGDRSYLFDRYRYPAEKRVNLADMINNT